MSDTPVSLLERLQRRPDADSWRRLVELYEPLLRGWLARHTLQASDTDDLVQEVLAVVVRELPQFRHNQRPGAFRSWLRTVLVHRLRTFWQTRQARPPGTGDSAFLRMLDEFEDPHSGLSELWDREHDHYVLRRLLRWVERDFAPSTWHAFRRLALDGAEPDAVAAELGMTVNAICIAKSRVLQRLRQEARGLID
jgi:RNA polymerase sigma-70 factor (ECF subfamily)